LVCCSSLSQLADLRKEALAGWRLAAGGWPGKKVEIGEGEEMGGGSGFS